MPVVFQGFRTSGKIVVRRNGEEFSPDASLKVRSHSPNGFEWGYCGSGPAQLALALLLDVCGPVKARCLYQLFKREVVHSWKNAHFECTSVGILSWVDGKLKQVEVAAHLAEMEKAEEDDSPDDRCLEVLD